MGKSNFIVSNYRKLWLGSRNLFVVEPYIYQTLEKDRTVSSYSNVTVAPYRHQTANDLVEDAEYVDKKYERYVKILSERLNYVHRVTYKEAFWKKSLSLGFIRYITTMHDIFQKSEMYFNPRVHECNVLSEKSYYIPFDFEDHRTYFQNADFGLEQMFSIYLHIFHKEACTTIDVVEAALDNVGEHNGLIARTSLKGSKIKKALHWIYSFSYGKLKEIVKKRKEDRQNPSIKVGIVGSFFSDKNYHTLVERGNGKIALLDWQVDVDYKNQEIFGEKRKYLSKYEDDFDRFDKFFFNSLNHCLPRVFVEKFCELENLYKKQMSKYTGLKYVISEGWISNTYMSICVAILQQNGVKHITNEHNALTVPYKGSFISHITGLSDIFVSLGWKDTRIPNLVKGASLYPFTVEGEYKKTYKILYISCVQPVKMAHYVSHYGADEENSARNLAFVKKFFSSISTDTFNDLAYRAYPTPYIQLLSYDKEFALGASIAPIKNYTDTKEPGKIQMKKAELVIIDYISTSHLEALIMDIPVLFFWNPDTYYLNDNYADFFQPLIDAGICQTDPVEAALFLEKIKDDPQAWWQTEQVQAKKNEWLNTNIGKPEVMIDYLLQLAV